MQIFFFFGDSFRHNKEAWGPETCIFHKFHCDLKPHVVMSHLSLQDLWTDSWHVIRNEHWLLTPRTLSKEQTTHFSFSLSAVTQWPEWDKEWSECEITLTFLFFQCLFLAWLSLLILAPLSVLPIIPTWQYFLLCIALRNLVEVNVCFASIIK